MHIWLFSVQIMPMITMFVAWIDNRRGGCGTFIEAIVVRYFMVVLRRNNAHDSHVCGIHG
jgi:hypothetical protein